MGLSLSYRGSAPEDLSAFRVWAVAFAEREGGISLPLADRGLLLRLHPAGEAVPLRLDGDRIYGDLSTSSCGPGYHAAVCRLLDDLRRLHVPDLEVDDATDYYRERARAPLERAVLQWRVMASHQALVALRATGKRIYFGIPHGALPPRSRSRRVVTPLMSYTEQAWIDAADEVARGDHLDAHFAWWNDERDAAYWRNLSIAYLRVRGLFGRNGERLHLERALEASAQAVALGAAPPLPEGRLAAVLEELGRPQDAVPHVEAAVSESPANTGLRAWLASLYEQLGRRDDAALEMERLSSRLPASASAAYEAGRLLNDVERFDRALLALSRAVALEPRRAAHHGELAVALAGLGRTLDALCALDRALEREPLSVTGWENRALLLQSLGRDSEAERARARARDIEAGCDHGQDR